MGRRVVAILIVLTVMIGFSNTGMSKMWGNRGGGYGGGANFVDENGDGICDNLNRGDCPGYIDENGDGICDYSKGGRCFSGCGCRGKRAGIPPINIFDGIPFTYSGKVMRIGYGRAGMTIETEGGEVVIYGIGPLWFWDCKDSSRPVVGDMIEVSGYLVEYNDVQRNIATSVTIDGEIIELRDTETGAPLWRGSNRWSCQ